MGYTGVGTGFATPHQSIVNLWVREFDPSNGDLILSGLIKNVSDNALDTTTLTYSHGCILTQVDGTTNLSAQWENIGSAISPAWQRWSDQ